MVVMVAPISNTDVCPQVSKAASVQMTRQLAFDFSHKNIQVRVNGIAPGWFPSEMTTGGSDDNNQSTAQDDAGFQKEMDAINARVPPGRMGNAADLASVSEQSTPTRTPVSF